MATSRWYCAAVSMPLGDADAADARARLIRLATMAASSLSSPRPATNERSTLRARIGIALEVEQRAVAGAEVVDGHGGAERVDRVQRDAGRLGVLHDRRLGHLDEQPLGRQAGAGERALQRRHEVGVRDLPHGQVHRHVEPVPLRSHAIAWAQACSSTQAPSGTMSRSPRPPG
jgi:hypothetical protein